MKRGLTAALLFWRCPIAPPPPAAESAPPSGDGGAPQAQPPAGEGGNGYERDGQGQRFNRRDRFRNRRDRQRERYREDGLPRDDGQQEDDRLGAGQHRQGQLRLAAQGVEARGVEDAQALAAEKAAADAAKADPAYHTEMNEGLKHYVGRPSPLYLAERLTEHFGGANVWLKREDLNHTGAHKINNCMGQILLARRMGKTRIIAETGAGQHGVASATVSARFDLPCTVYMGAVDVERQKPNVFRMNLLGAEVRPVTSGSATLKDAMNEALRDWVTNVDDTFYLIGTVAGPHPYPMMVRDFQRVIGDECLVQMPEMLGQAPAMQDVFRAIGRLAHSNVTVLITGESGSGKELVARALHKQLVIADLHADSLLWKRDITERADVTERTFYRHFGDKREVLFDRAGTTPARTRS